MAELSVKHLKSCVNCNEKLEESGRNEVLSI